MLDTTADGARAGCNSARCLICGAPTEALFPFAEGPFVASCTDCGTQALFPQPTPEQLAAYYRDYATTNTADEQIELLVRASRATMDYYREHSRLRDFAGRTYFEVGFGNAAGLFAAAEAGMQVQGCDLDGSNVARARARASERGTTVTLYEGGADVIPRDQRFDLIRASQVIEHTLDPRGFVATLARLQRPGGIVAIDCPHNRAAFWFVKNALRRRYRRENFFNALKLNEHLWGFTRVGLRRVLEDGGYEVLHLSDYPMQGSVVQPEASLWYPSVRSALRAAVRRRDVFPVLKAAIGTFDRTASIVAGAGMGLVAIARLR